MTWKQGFIWLLYFSVACTESDLTRGLKEPPTHSLTPSLTHNVVTVAVEAKECSLSYWLKSFWIWQKGFIAHCFCHQSYWLCVEGFYLVICTHYFDHIVLQTAIWLQHLSAPVSQQSASKHLFISKKSSTPPPANKHIYWQCNHSVLSVCHVHKDSHTQFPWAWRGVRGQLGVIRSMIGCLQSCECHMLSSR